MFITYVTMNHPYVHIKLFYLVVFHQPNWKICPSQHEKTSSPNFRYSENSIQKNVMWVAFPPPKLTWLTIWVEFPPIPNPENGPVRVPVFRPNPPHGTNGKCSQGSEWPGCPNHIQLPRPDHLLSTPKRPANDRSSLGQWRKMVGFFDSKRSWKHKNGDGFLKTLIAKFHDLYICVFFWKMCFFGYILRCGYINGKKNWIL